VWKRVKEMVQQGVTKKLLQCTRPLLSRARKMVREASAADEMHNFQLVTVADVRCWPAVARNQLAVKLDGHAIWLHAELRNEISER
jgi:hypothetical protein